LTSTPSSIVESAVYRENHVRRLGEDPSEGPRTDQMTITVVSLTTFTVIKELFVPRGEFVLSQAVP